MSKAEDRYLEHFQYGMLRNCSSKESFLLGYHQAEKDLDVVSWVKEVSGVKELSRAEEEALKAYPPQSIAANYDTINRRDAFEYGYLKAEKDLELTWEDIDWIVGEAVFRVSEDSDKEQICKEVLKLFKDFKERKGEEV